MRKFEYAQPENVANVFPLLDKPDSVLKAGGVDLLDLMKEGIVQPNRLVNIRSLPELKFMREEKDGWHLGPAVTLAELADNPKLNSGPYRCLSQAAAGAATPQIRNMATLAGNLCQRPRCWYFRSEDFHCARKGGDICFAMDGENQYHAIFGNQDGCAIVHPSAIAVALSAFGAKLTIKDGKKERQIAISDFFVPPATDITREHILKPTELITDIILPKPTGNTVSFYFKQKEKQAFDWPISEVAVVLEMDGNTCRDARIVLGAAAPIPWRIEKAENKLKGKTIGVELARRAADAALQDATPLSQNGFKVPVFRAVIYRTICWAASVDPLANV